MGNSTENKAKADLKSEEGIKSAIKGILFLMEQHYSSKLEEIQKSDALINIGEKTELTSQIEKLFNNPLNELYELHKTSSSIVFEIVDSLVISFFKHNSDLISKLYRNKGTVHSIGYNIVLKEDSFENRETILSFFEFYNLIDISLGCPVYFQFVPVELAPKLKNVEELIYAEPSKSGQA